MVRISSLVFALALLMVAATSCSDDDSTALMTVTLVPTFNGQEIQSEQVIQDKTGRNFYLRDMRLYVSNLYLLRDDGGRVLLEDLALLEWPGSKSSIEAVIPQGDYQGVEFHIGLDPITNSALPTDFAADHPLSAEQDMHWGMLKYRFLIFEGQVDTSAADNLAPQTPLVYHLGRDELYTSVTIIRNAPVSGVGVFFTLNFEVNDMFDGPAGVIDISQERVNHSGEADMAEAALIMENFASAFE